MNDKDEYELLEFAPLITWQGADDYHDRWTTYVVLPQPQPNLKFDEDFLL